MMYKFNSLKANQKLVYLIGSLPIVILFYIIPIYGDDVGNKAKESFFKNPLNDLMFVWHQYFTWSSRTIINFFMYQFESHSTIWFALFAGAMFFLATDSLSKIINKNATIKVDVLIILFLYCLPYQSLVTAGWIATTVTYFFPTCLGIYSLVSIFSKGIVSKLERLLSGLALLVASNNEQIAVFMFILYLLLITNNYCKRVKNSRTIIINFLIVLFSIFYIVLCPGNKIRNRLHPAISSFNKVSIFTKIDIGLTTTAQHVVFGMIISMLLIASTMVLYHIYKYQRHRQNQSKIIASIFLLVCLLISGISFYIRFNFKCTYLMNKILTFPFWGIHSEIINNRYLLIQPIIYSLVLFLFWYIIHDSSNKSSSLIIFILFSGLVSRLVMIQSSTIYISATRTFFIFETSLVLSALYYSRLIIFSANRKLRMINWIMVSFFAVTNILIFIATINLKFPFLYHYLILWFMSITN